MRMAISAVVSRTVMAIRMGVKRSEISSSWGRALNQIGSHFYRDTCFPEDRICAESHAREKDFKKHAVASSPGLNSASVPKGSSILRCVFFRV